eukprot:4398612-Ditylum_brightwellii.AAC.1
MDTSAEADSILICVFAPSITHVSFWAQTSSFSALSLNGVSAPVSDIVKEQNTTRFSLATMFLKFDQLWGVVQPDISSEEGSLGQAADTE